MQFVKIKNIYINRNHISMISLKENFSLVVDFNYSKENGEPVFLSFQYDTEEAAQAALSSLISEPDNV